MPTCVDCGKEVDEVCGDGFCRECHVSLTFEDCISNTSVARRNLQGMLAVKDRCTPPMSRKEVIAHIKDLYPSAELEEYKEL